MFYETIKFSSHNVAALKKALRKRYPSIRSSHADEALAASFGFKTYAAMLNVLNHMSNSARFMVQTDACLLMMRLEELGYSGLAVQELRRTILEASYPDEWVGDELERSLVRRRIPDAANG
ncbi:hypothetical protein K9B32_07505 [Rhizobium sp. 3T7]|uniref:hypothetical protein n=1 Tax=Rhizobium sp. 3T7 TaxID=2874922 RepID=UPI001CC9BF78|nr:hypothetical protein [Rhizobium sp. 3T7]MBZ9789975.1 hypothetical protein [Rhizobium sp. 3T7]